MKKFSLILCFVFAFFAWSCYVQNERRNSLYELENARVTIPVADSLTILTNDVPEKGNAEAGYQYLVYGNAFKTGIPFNLYKFFNGLKNSPLAKLSGYNKYVVNDPVVYTNDKGRLTATPGCLHCHAQQFEGKLVIGLGNSYSNFFRDTRAFMNLLKAFMKIWYGKNSDKWKTAELSFQVNDILAEKILTEVQGPAPAQKIAEVMASHRDPVTLKLRSDTSYFNTPGIVIPEDIPALWIAKKRKAFTVNAMRQGDFLKHIITPNILTLNDTLEAKKIYEHSKDVWAYLNTLEPPPYPRPVKHELVLEGKRLFNIHCSNCHGRYDRPDIYPNKIIAPDIISTDSLMWKYFLLYPEYADWYNKSWFATSSSASYTRPQAGYVAPPLDGVWITAPYLHNGSVPTIEGVLNSKIRPRYWKRNFHKEEYDYENPGWKYKTLSRPGNKQTYNSDIPGYGNYGHLFGDRLTENERKAVIEYLKTL